MSLDAFNIGGGQLVTGGATSRRGRRQDGEGVGQRHVRWRAASYASCTVGLFVFANLANASVDSEISDSTTET